MKRRFAGTAAWVAVFCALTTGCASTQHSLLHEGIAHYGAGRDNDAVAVLTEAAGKPGNELPWVHKMRAGAYMRLGMYDLALADIERFLPKAADNDDASHGFLMRGSIHASMGRLDMAEADLETSLALKPSKWHAHAQKSLEAFDEIARNAAGRGWLGAVLRTPAAGDPGIPVSHVVPGSPAEKAGIRNGDAILAWDGAPVAGLPEFQWQVASAPPGTTAQVDVLRGGTKVRITAVLEELAFRREERRYIGMAVKPPLPEEARRYRIQAEQAIERKEFAIAADRYRDALRVAPWWPEGRFNRALILAELGQHALAIREMKRYLLLAPEAADTRAAQDQIYKWEGLAK